MALYTAICKKCGHVEDYIASIEDRHNTPEHCEQKMEKMITAAMVSPEYHSFHSPIDGSFIENRTQFYAHMKKHNVVPYSDVIGVKPPESKGTNIKQDIAEAMHKLGG